MKVDKYLCITAKGAARLLSSRPKSLAATEIMVKLKLEVPDALFKKPTFEATIKVDPSLSTQVTINVDTIHNIEKVLRDQLGLNITIEKVDTK